MKKKLIIVGGLLLLIGVSVGLSFVVNNMFGNKLDAAAPVIAEALPEETHYYNVQPEFVVNFQGKSRVKFLMIELVVAANDEETAIVLDDHDPELRNALLMLFSRQDSETLKTVEGKDVLRADAKAVIEELVASHHKPDRVKDVFITRLVMQ
ncbi:MAG: flagellar basal body-associated FliL family protein [Granulosicoccus sp.]